MTFLLEKYNRPGPRYTSYPAVPHWNTTEFQTQNWLDQLTTTYQQALDRQEGLSIYVHLPFCESLCTFCGCNKRITKNHNHESPYIEALLQEWKLYSQYLGGPLPIKEIHLGGGTPTFFSPKNLTYLLEGILSQSLLMPDCAFSFEGHPNNTTEEHLQALYQLGFDRVSFGVQDYNPVVQKAINRIQPFEKVAYVTETARKIGYQSIGHDIVYGLPFQTTEHIVHSLQRTHQLMPDRIAFYSYAHVPWIPGNGQRGFQEKDLPDPVTKRQLYELGKQQLETFGYTEIGMDHFALPHDSLYQSMKNNTLHRNFMGYTTAYSSITLGLGVSAISSCPTAFAQNEKKLEEYYKVLTQNQLPISKGHIRSEADQTIGSMILDLTCQFSTEINPEKFEKSALIPIFNNLKELQQDGIIHIDNHRISITEIGRPFIRNVCMAIDPRLISDTTNKPQFSMTV